MRKVFLLLAFIPFLLQAQLQKERRVYYLDCSFSMVKGGLNLKVCDNLINAIDKVEDQTTELLVIPFAFNNDKNAVLTPITAKATEAGKKQLKKAILDIKWDNPHTMTYHKDPIENFDKRILDDGLTYMFLMTDGQDEWPDPNIFLNDLKAWGGKYGDKDVYGFYVMLDKAARYPDAENIIDGQPHFWNVSTANVNIHITRAENKAVFNIRNDEYVDIPIVGPTNGYEIKVNTVNDNYEITNYEITDGKLRLNIKGKQAESLLPPSEVVKAEISVEKTPGDFYFWVTDVINIKCNNKLEPAITSYTIK